MVLILSISLSILPVVLIIGLYYWTVDRQLSNGIKISLWVLGVGILTALPSYFIESKLVRDTLHIDGIGASFVEAFLFVALVEEGFKWIFFRLSAIRQKWLTRPLHYLAAGLIISLGFAMSENVLYALLFDWRTILVRVFTAVPSHATFGVIMGYYMYRYRVSHKKLDLALSFSLPFLIHGLYDFFIVQTISETLLGGALIVLLVSIIWNIWLIRSVKGIDPRLIVEDREILDKSIGLVEDTGYDPLAKIILREEE